MRLGGNYTELILKDNVKSKLTCFIYEINSKEILEAEHLFSSMMNFLTSPIHLSH